MPLAGVGLLSPGACSLCFVRRGRFQALLSHTIKPSKSCVPAPPRFKSCVPVGSRRDGVAIYKTVSDL